MSSGYRVTLALAAALCAGTAAAADLRVCADPDNLPYSNRQQQGFENKLAELIGRDLGRPVRTVWIPQRGPFFKALQHGVCDVVMGVPSGFEEALTTDPYYRSSYVFATPRAKHLAIRSFDDPRLKKLRIGLQVVAQDDGDVPPAQALAHRGLVRNISWYRINQNYLGANQPTRLLEGVEHGDVDVAIVWGPMAGYFAKTTGAALELTPVSPQAEGAVPFAFDISVGVRPGDTKLQAQLTSLLHRRQAEIHQLLEDYGVPLVSRRAARQTAANR